MGAFTAPFFMGIYIQERDKRIFNELEECNFLTVSQLALLCFEGKKEAAKKRLQKLSREGLLRRNDMGFGLQSIYTLTKDAIALDPKPYRHRRNLLPKPVFLRHELFVRDFRALLLTRGIQEFGGAAIENCSINAHFLAFRCPRGRILPDGYFEVQSPFEGTSSFFFEIDRGTESQSIIAARIIGYRYFLKSGMFAKRIASHAVSSNGDSFRVLFVFHSLRRMNAVLRTAFQLQVGNFILGTTLADNEQTLVKCH
jgi:hypothetical protein